MGYSETASVIFLVTGLHLAARGASWAGRIVCSNDSEGYASSSVATPTVTQTRQVSAVGPDEVCSMWGQRGLFRCLPIFLSRPTLKSKPGRPG